MAEATADQGASEFTVTAITSANGVRTTVLSPTMQPQTLVDHYSSSDESADENVNPANNAEKKEPSSEGVPAEVLAAEAVVANDLSADDGPDVAVPASTKPTGSKVTHRTLNSDRIREIMVPSSSQEDEEEDSTADNGREIPVPSSSQEDEEDPAANDGRVILVPSSSQEDEEEEEVAEANSSDDREVDSSSDEASSPDVVPDPAVQNEEIAEVPEPKRVTFAAEAEVRRIPIVDSNALHEIGKTAHSRLASQGLTRLVAV